LDRKRVGDAPQDVPIFRRRDGGDVLAIGVFDSREEGASADFLPRLDQVAIDAVDGSWDPEIAIDDRRLAAFGRHLVDHAQKPSGLHYAFEMVGDIGLFDEADAPGFGESGVLAPSRPAGAAPRRLIEKRRIESCDDLGIETFGEFEIAPIESIIADRLADGE